MSETTNTNEIILTGCSPVPLSSYLKAIGILRLVAGQKDSDLSAFWRDGTFVLSTWLSKDQLVDFFLNEYEPTPIVSPWNGGSGFFASDAKGAINAMAAGRARRLAPYRDAVKAAFDLLVERGVHEKPSAEAKPALLAALRSRLPDSTLDWFDASVVLTSSGLAFPPLLGTGGNDGRLEFSNNHMQRLVSLIDPSTGEPTDEARAQIGLALFDFRGYGLGGGAVGQFSPGAAGGANASTGFSGDPMLTAWDFVLMLEGALLFAAAAARRLEARDPALLVAPFTVRASGSGAGAADIADEDDARAEFWAPVWKRPAPLGDIETLLHEGRAAMSRRQARDGLDFVRAIARLGVARGIDAFERFGFLMRSGRTYFATPLGKIKVERNVDAELIDDLDHGAWLDRFRRLARGDSAPHRLRVVARNLENALFEMARLRGDPQQIQNALIALGAAALELARGGARKENEDRLGPPPPLSPSWIERADDGSMEFRIAAALASIGGWPEGTNGNDESSDGRVSRRAHTWLPMAAHTVPLDEGMFNPERGRRKFAFASTSALTVWGPGELAGNLVAVGQRRLVEAERRGLEDKPLAGHPSLRAELSDILGFLDRATDDARIGALVLGLVWTDLGTLRSSRQHRRWQIALRARERSPARPLPLAFAVLRPLLAPDRDLRRDILHPDTQRRIVPLAEGSSLPIPPGLLRLLESGGYRSAVTSALRRLHASGLVCSFASAKIAVPFDGQRLAASLLIPISRQGLTTVIARAFLTDGGESDAA